MHAERWQTRTTLVSLVMTALVAGTLLATHHAPQQRSEVSRVVDEIRGFDDHRRCGFVPRRPPPPTTRVVAPCTYEPDIVELLEQIAALDVAIDELSAPTAAVQRARADLARLHADAARLRLVLETRRLRCAEDLGEPMPRSHGYGALASTP